MQIRFSPEYSDGARTRRAPKLLWPSVLSLATQTVLTIGLCMVSSATVAYQSRSSRGLHLCSAWDVHITTQIEDFGTQQIVSGRDLLLARFQQLKARDLCNRGKTTEAVLVYEEIDFIFCPGFPCVNSDAE